MLFLGVAFFAVMYLLGLFSIFVLGRSNLYGTIGRFHLEGEANLPAWYATLLLFACAVVFAVITVKKHADRDPFTRHWLGLALILLYLSADEGSQLHELFRRPMDELTGGFGGWLRFGWVVPAGLIALVIGIAYLRFLRHLPPAIARRFVLAGAIFLGAAIGLETIGGWYITLHTHDVGYDLLAGLEEVLEKVGVILAIDAALAYLATQTAVIRLRLLPLADR